MDDRRSLSLAYEPVMEALAGAVPSNPSGLCLSLVGRGQILGLDKENAKGTR